MMGNITNMIVFATFDISNRARKVHIQIAVTNDYNLIYLW